MITIKKILQLKKEDIFEFRKADFDKYICYSNIGAFIITSKTLNKRKIKKESIDEILNHLNNIS